MSIPVKIGYEKIYPQTRKAAKEIVEILEERDFSPFHAAECQQGKTLVAATVVDAKLRQAIKQGKSLHVVVAIADAKKDLRNQTDDRFGYYLNKKGIQCGADLRRKFDDANRKIGKKDFFKLTIVHRSELKKLELHACDWRFIVLDEAHIAEVKHSDGGEINRFFARCGIDVSKCPKDWVKGRTTNYLLPISATGYSWLTAERTRGTFKTVYMERSPLYTGMPELFERLINLYTPIMIKVNGAWIVSLQFRTEILPHFLLECDTHGMGYCLTRLQGKALTAFKVWCNENGYLFREATLASGEIDSIMDILENKPTKPTFLLISGIFRAGMTIEDDSNIRMAIEFVGGKGSSGGVDSATQALVGRSMGYGKNNPYPIYCNMRKIEESLRHIMGMRRHGPQSEATHIPRSKHTTANTGKRWNYEWHARNPRPDQTPRRQSHNKMDFAEMIFEGTERSSHRRIGNEVYHIDSKITKDGIPIHSGIKLGYWTRGSEKEMTLGPAFKAPENDNPFTSSPRIH